MGFCRALWRIFAVLADQRQDIFTVGIAYGYDFIGSMVKQTFKRFAVGLISVLVILLLALIVRTQERAHPLQFRRASIAVAGQELMVEIADTAPLRSQGIAGRE